MVVDVDVEFKSTTGFTADCDRGAGTGVWVGGGAGGTAAGAAATAAVEAAGVETCVVDLLTVRIVCLAGFTAADLTCFTVFTVFVACVLTEVPGSVTAGVESVAVEAGALDVSAGAVSAGAGAEAAGGAVSVGTGCAC